MTKPLATCSNIVYAECPRCGRYYPFGPILHNKRVSNKDKFRAGWHTIRKKFLFLFFKNIIVCSDCAIENSLNPKK